MQTHYKEETFHKYTNFSVRSKGLVIILYRGGGKKEVGVKAISDWQEGVFNF